MISILQSKCLIEYILGREGLLSMNTYSYETVWWGAFLVYYVMLFLHFLYPSSAIPPCSVYHEDKLSRVTFLPGQTAATSCNGAVPLLPIFTSGASKLLTTHNAGLVLASTWWDRRSPMVIWGVVNSSPCMCSVKVSRCHNH